MDALPPPPPPPSGGPEPSPWLSRLVCFGFFAALFGRSWLSAGPADWTAAALTAAAGWTVLALARPPLWPRRAAGLLLLAASAACCFQAGGAGLGDFQSRLAAGLAAAFVLGGLYVGVWDESPDPRLGSLLATSGTLGLLAASLSRLTGGLPAVLARQWRQLSADGGPWRWGGLLAFGLVAWLMRLSRLRPERWSRKKAGGIVNWNR